VAHRIHINAVAYQEGDAWIAQGIEYDIVAHALDKSALADAFGRAVMENIIITQHLGREPLEGVKPAPEHFKELFDSARDEALPPSYVDGAEVSVRVAA
jgi:hypothetical protein